MEEEREGERGTGNNNNMEYGDGVKEVRQDKAGTGRC